MHARRKKERPQVYAPDGSHLEVDAVYWQQVAERDRASLANVAFFEPVDPDVLQFRFLPVDMADAGFRLLPFPRVPLYLLLWLGDDEFKPRIQVLFDRPIESLLAADAIWALVNRVAIAMTQG